MRNDFLCNVVSGIGCVIAFLCFVCYFFGMGFGLWGTFIGIGLMGIALVNYD